jgi:CRP-like cAMP-binding protein
MAAEAHFVGPVERLLFMKTIPALRGVDIELLATVARSLEEQSYDRGETIFRRGELADRMCVVVSGRIEQTHAGQPFVIAAPGDNVGILHALADSDELDAIAEVDTLVLEHPMDRFFDLYEEHFPLLQNSIVQLARFQRSLLEHVADGTVRSAWDARQVMDIPNRDLDVVERLVLMSRGEVFRNIGVGALALMAQALRQERFPKGTRLWQRSDAGGDFHVILEGEIEARWPGGSFRARPGYPLGSVETLARNPRWYDAVALTDVVTLRGDHEILFDVLEDDFDVAMDFVSSMARGILASTSQLAAKIGPLDGQAQFFLGANDRANPDEAESVSANPLSFLDQPQ